MSKEPREKLLGRWSRLKSAPRDVAPPADAKRPATADPSAQPPAEAIEADLPPLPAIDDLKPDSDIAAFLRKGVPEELKRLAMRRMWTLDPAIRDFVEIAENQYDFNAVDGVPGFGEIAPGTSISDLLAQATGSGTPRPDGPTRDPHHIAAVDIEHEARSLSPMPQADPRDSVRRSDNQVPDVTGGSGDVLDATPIEPAQAGQPPVRRRHGGALPV